MTHSSSFLQDPKRLDAIASQVGTPFYLYDGAILQRHLTQLQELTSHEGLQARYAMKACSAHRLLHEMLQAGIWIDAVSANECLRAAKVGFSGGNQPPVLLYTADVFRDDWVQVIQDFGVLPNLGSPGMLRDLQVIGYQGPIGLRMNPGFGHGHVDACDTGGPSSKHGIWHDELLATAKQAQKQGLTVNLLHAHVGTGPQPEELLENLNRLVEVFAELIPHLPEVEGVNLGGGLPYPYRPEDRSLDLTQLGQLLQKAHERLSRVARRPIRLEIEPGRYLAAGAGALVARVTDVKQTRSNAKGHGATFVMVDAGFTELVRPAMYGAYHSISIPARAQDPTQPLVVAGPLCESGDVFTRHADELLEPRELPCPQPGDLLAFHDAGAYGFSMSSNYNSIGRPPQIWIEPNGETTLISRRETLDDLLQTECHQALTLP